MTPVSIARRAGPDLDRRSTRRAHAVAATAWIALLTADVAAGLHYLPWLPPQAHGAAVGLCVTASVIAAWRRTQAPIEAAFLHGVMFARDTAATQLLPVLPKAVGDDQPNPFTQPRRRPGSRRR